MNNEEILNAYRHDINEFKEDFYAIVSLIRLYNSSVKNYLEGGSFIDGDRYKTMNSIFYMSEVISGKLNEIEAEMQKISSRYQ